MAACSEAASSELRISRPDPASRARKVNDGIVLSSVEQKADRRNSYAGMSNIRPTQPLLPTLLIVILRSNFRQSRREKDTDDMGRWLASFGKRWPGAGLHWPASVRCWPALASVWPQSGQFVSACWIVGCSVWPLAGGKIPITKFSNDKGNPNSKVPIAD